MQEAIIFNIQKFSVNDGPGIRTTVFFKGCPLRCRWCANPESQLTSPQLLWDTEKCIRCHSCEKICPHQAISFEAEIPRQASPQAVTPPGEPKPETPGLRPLRCKSCGKCMQICPAGALTREGKSMTTQTVFEECLKDLPFYEESGGGVTFSGGEAMLWPDFVIELSGMLHEKGIPTAMETTGFASGEIFRKAAQCIDLFLFDMKHWNREKHILGTGVPNDRILENMRWAIGAGKDVLPRIPVIPGYNDSIEDAEGFAACLGSVHAGRAQLLPFHQFGEKKYRFLTRDYSLEGVMGLHPEDLTDFAAKMRECGIDAFF